MQLISTKSWLMVDLVICVCTLAVAVNDFCMLYIKIKTNVAKFETQ